MSRYKYFRCSLLKSSWLIFCDRKLVPEMTRTLSSSGSFFENVRDFSFEIQSQKSAVVIYRHYDSAVVSSYQLSFVDSSVA